MKSFPKSKSIRTMYWRATPEIRSAYRVSSRDPGFAHGPLVPSRRASLASGLCLGAGFEARAPVPVAARVL